MGSLPLVAAPAAARPYVLGRVAGTLTAFVLTSAVAYVALVALPVRWLRYLPSRTGGTIDLREQLGVDGPLHTEFLPFLWRFVSSGSTGTSLLFREDTAHVVQLAAPVTVWIVLGGLLAGLAVALPLGAVSALFPRSPAAAAVRGLTRMTASLPPVLIAMLLVSVIAFRLERAPLAGYCDLVGTPPAAPCGGAVEWAKHLMLPWATLGAVFGVVYTPRVGDALRRRLAACGSPGGAAPIGRPLARGLESLAARAPGDLAVALGASLFVEHVFGLDGLGRTLIRAGLRFDLPLIAGVVLWAAAAALALRLLVDSAAQLASQGAHSRS